MDRTTKVLGRIGVSVLVAGMTLLLLFLGGGPADAQVSMGYSSIDNPAGEAFMAILGTAPADMAAASAVSAAGGTSVAAASTGAAGLVTTAAWAGVPVAVGGALVVGVGGVAAAHFYAPKSSTTLTQTPGLPEGYDQPLQQGPFGWLGSTVDFQYAHFNGSFLGQSVSGTGYVTLVMPAGPQDGVYRLVGWGVGAEVYCRNLTTGVVSAASGSLGGSSTGGSVRDVPAVTLTYPMSGGVVSCPAGSGFDHVRLTAQSSQSTTTPKTNVTVFTDYFPVGHQNWTPGTPSGLTGTLVTTADCVSASGTRSFSSSVAAAGAGDAAPLEWPGVTCNSGETLGHFKVEWVVPNKPTSTVYEYTAPGWVTNMPVEYPGCVDGGCEVELWKIVTGSPSLYCGTAAVGCPEWWSDSAKADHFECRYGPYTAPLGLCAVFRDPGKISPNTTIRVDTGGSVVGSPEPIISTNPADFVNTPVVTDPVPGPAPAPVPTGTPDPLPSSNSSQCYPSGWGIFNPLEWVYRPIVCAFTWAFVPGAGTAAAIETVRQTASNTEPLSWGVDGATGIAGAVQTMRTSGGCGDAPLTIQAPGGGGELDMCAAASSIRQTPAGTVIFTTLQVLIWSGAVLAVWHRASGSFGARS